MPIVREPDGLALSSRNVYLTPEERPAATVLNRALRLAEELFSSGEINNADVIRGRMRDMIFGESLAEVDYISVADAASLEELERIHRPALVSLAVRFGTTRLIDNVVLSPTNSNL
jgi:pantoate--beta-alanine ligase